MVAHDGENPAYRVHGAFRHYGLGTGQSLALAGRYELERGKRATSADVGFRLGKYFSLTSQISMNPQTDYDLRVAAVNAPPSKIKPRAA